MNTLSVLVDFQNIFSPFNLNTLIDFILAFIALLVLNMFVDFFAKRKGKPLDNEQKLSCFSFSYEG